MSQKPILSVPSRLEVYTELCKSARPTLSNLFFLLSWYGVNGFGFKEVRGLEAQCKMAMDFLTEAEREWPKTEPAYPDESFIDFFISKAKNHQLDLPADFKDKLLKEMESL